MSTRFSFHFIPVIEHFSFFLTPHSPLAKTPPSLLAKACDMQSPVCSYVVLAIILWSRRSACTRKLENGCSKPFKTLISDPQACDPPTSPQPDVFVKYKADSQVHKHHTEGEILDIGPRLCGFRHSLYRGAWEAQWLGRWALGFSLGCDGRVMRSSPGAGSALRGGLLSLSLCSSSHPLALSNKNK